KVGFGPYVPAVFHGEYPDEYHGVSVADALASVDHIFKTMINANEVAAMIVEPVQGEGGFNPAPKEFLEGLRKKCDENGILLIADEIQSGMGRTGKYFAFEHVGVEPDFVCIAKSIAAGLPLSALTGKAELMDKVVAGSMGSTYGGNPVACAAALAVFDIFEEEGLLQRAVEIGERTAKRWRALQDGAGKGLVGDVRQVGGMVAVEFVKNGDPKQPNGDLAGAILTEARSRGLIMTTAGAYAQCLRSLVPLVISNDLLDEGLDIFEAAVEAAVKG
ncbi:MAG: aminotransferase class III-fold pyridoxal phosphate-dependent enzyme, partial [Oricola sp.]|nr:aminotransferase class III-fold pyridoxal phosphate-dependent enzyme [Oricola sp.]